MKRRRYDMKALFIGGTGTISMGIVRRLSEDMVYVHTDPESTCTFRILHLVLYLAVIRVGFYYPHCLCPRIGNSLKLVVLHHTAEVKYV